ncbi:MAG: DUF2228 domain-containing protein [Myxococcales bacterium]
MPSMSMETEDGTSYAVTGGDRVADTIRQLDADANSFAILSRGDAEYLQAARYPDGSWSLEYRDGSAQAHFAAIDRDLGVERIAEAFSAYATQGDFKARFAWQVFSADFFDEEPRRAPLTEAEQTQARMLTALYGLEFPNSLLQFHAFISGPDRELWEEARSALGLSVTGPLDVLKRVEDGDEVKPLADILLHWRFYRDPPEFFSTLHGDVDGLHWGLLLDCPEQGFRGAASYYNNDGDLIRIYGGLFDAVFQRAGDIVSELDERIEDDPQEEDYYRAGAKKIVAFTRALRAFVVERRIPLWESSARRVTSVTGLGAVLPADAKSVVSEAGDSTAARVEALLKACKQGRPGGALLLGRELWHFGGDTRSEDAYQLLRAAYAALGRDVLIRVLDAHYQGRDRKSVDLLGKGA